MQAILSLEYLDIHLSSSEELNAFGIHSWDHSGSIDKDSPYVPCIIFLLDAHADHPLADVADSQNLAAVNLFLKIISKLFRIVANHFCILE